MKNSFWRDPKGSASVEFILLAIPLFFPIFLYLNNFALASDTQENLRTIARESARAFVTSPNDEVAFEVAQSVMNEAGAILGFNQPDSALQLEIECSKRPCISSDNRITLSIKSSKNAINVSVIEYVSPWA